MKKTILNGIQAAACEKCEKHEKRVLSLKKDTVWPIQRLFLFVCWVSVISGMCIESDTREHVKEETQAVIP